MKAPLKFELKPHQNKIENLDPESRSPRESCKFTQLLTGV